MGVETEEEEDRRIAWNIESQYTGSEISPGSNCNVGTDDTDTDDCVVAVVVVLVVDNTN